MPGPFLLMKLRLLVLLAAALLALARFLTGLALLAGLTLLATLLLLLTGLLSRLRLVLAFLLAYALDPLVGLLEKIKVPRALGALLVFAGLTAGGIAAAGAIVRFFSDEVVDLAREVPDRLVVGRAVLRYWPSISASALLASRVKRPRRI